MTGCKALLETSELCVQENMHLSDDQTKDLLFLRRLFLTRRCVLSMARKALISQLADTDSQVLNPTENILTVEHLTKTLRENAAEDHELYYKVARAMFRGVSLMHPAISCIQCSMLNRAWCK